MSIELIPESAPFNSEQRAWLNGFFAGILRTLDTVQAQGGSQASLAAAAASLLPSLGSSDDSPSASGTTLNTQGQPADGVTYPWHDSSLAISERMELAAGRAHPERLMAAMAQLDCGTCGYVCKTYAEALANGSEKNATLCSPGGTETVKMIRSLIKSQSASVTNAAATVPDAAAFASGPLPNSIGRVSVTAKLVSSTCLNGAGSQKDTRHVVIDLTGTKLNYQVGDALGLLPTNCPKLVIEVMRAAGIDECDLATAEALSKRCLRTITSELCDLINEIVRPTNGQLTDFQDSDNFYEWDVLECLQHFASNSLPATRLVTSLAELKPRLYSIASSQAVFNNEVHLTVGRVEESVRDRQRKGVASTMLADRLDPGEVLQVFVQPHHGFTIPQDGSRDMIMVGPGTGIAPFIAFLQQRQHDQATGRNWLFFGDQRRKSDFLYEEQLCSWNKSGLLSRLDLAFSRDDVDKVYVQHRMLEQAAEVYSWLMGGCHFYICGDAKRMAKDVERTLISILQSHGKMDASNATAWLNAMKQSGRYACDVY